MKSTIQRAWGNPFKDTLFAPFQADSLDDHAVIFQQHLAARHKAGASWEHGTCVGWTYPAW